MAVIRNGEVVSTPPWWHVLSPMKLFDFIILFFQTLVSPEPVAAIRARNAARRTGSTPAPIPRPMGREQTNVRTLGRTDCGPGGG